MNQLAPGCFLKFHIFRDDLYLLRLVTFRKLSIPVIF